MLDVRKIIRGLFEIIFFFACPIMFGAFLLVISKYGIAIYIIYSFVWLLLWDEGKIFKIIG